MSEGIMNVPIQLVSEPIEDSTDENDIRTIFGNYLLNKISHEEASNRIRSICGNTNSLDTIDEVLAKSARQLSGSLTRSKSKRWTEEEDMRLKEAIDKYGTENWSAVASYVGGERTKSQCSQRWKRCLNPNITHASWTHEEELKLIEIVHRFSERSWARVAQDFPGRTDVQCRFRYKFIMKKNGNQGQLDGIPIHNEFAGDLDISAQNDGLQNEIMTSNSESIHPVNLDQTTSEHN